MSLKIAQLLVASTDATITSIRITKCLDNPAERHTLPGLLADLYDATDHLIAIASEADPDVARAFAAGLRSTQDLPAPEIIDFTLTPEAA